MGSCTHAMPAPRTLPMLLPLLALALPARAQDADYDAATQRARALEAAGRPGDAARALAPFAARFSEDHALALRLGWLFARAGEHRVARDHYARALRLSDGESLDAANGLAWAQLNAGEPAAARASFEAVLARDPRNASAREGLPLARAAEPRAVRVYAGLWTSAQLFPNHPTRRHSVSVAPTLTLTLGDLVLLGASWRAIAYGLVLTTNGRSAQRSALQQELFVTAGIVRPTFSVQLHYGHVWDAANSLLPAHVLGASARASLRGELYAEASASLYPDGTWLRLHASWSARLSAAWSLGPLLSVQSAAGSFGGSIGGSVTWRSPALTLTAAARFSDETRMTSLNESLTFATNDRIRGAASLTARIPLGRGLTLVPSYEYLRLWAAVTGGEVGADAHFLTIGLTGAW